MSLYNGYFAQGFGLDPMGTKKYKTCKEQCDAKWTRSSGRVNGKYAYMCYSKCTKRPDQDPIGDCKQGCKIRWPTNPRYRASCENDCPSRPYSDFRPYKPDTKPEEKSGWYCKYGSASISVTCDVAAVIGYTLSATGAGAIVGGISTSISIINGIISVSVCGSSLSTATTVAAAGLDRVKDVNIKVKAGAAVVDAVVNLGEMMSK